MLIDGVARERQDINRSRCHGNGKGEEYEQTIHCALTGNYTTGHINFSCCIKYPTVYKIRELQAQMESDVDQKHCRLVSYFCQGLQCGRAKCVQTFIHDMLQKAMDGLLWPLQARWLLHVDCVWNVMSHAQKPDFVFRAKRTCPFKSVGGVSSAEYWQPRCAHQR